MRMMDSSLFISTPRARCSANQGAMSGLSGQTGAAAAGGDALAGGGGMVQLVIAGRAAHRVEPGNPLSAALALSW